MKPPLVTKTNLTTNNRKSMKKYFVFAAAALVALASCSKVSPDVETPDEEITFQTANYSASTKADEGADKDALHRVFYSTGTFGVYSYFTNNTPSTTDKLSAGTEYMTNVAVSKRVSDGAYAPASTYYWPKAGMLSFVGYYPYNSTSPVTVTRGDATMTMAFNNYTVGTLSSQSASGKVTVTDGKVTDDQNDLMYADPSYGLSQQNPTAVHYKEGVPMLFHHMLAKVYFKVKLATLDENQFKLPLTTTLTAINVVRVADTGNGTVNPTATPAVTWTSTAPTASSTYDSGDFVANNTVIAKASAANKEASVSFTSDMLYVLPQTLVDGVCAVKVDYKVNDEVIPTTIVNLQPLTSSWEPNKIYCYTITINPFSGEILFDPGVEDWTNPTNVDSSIN